MKPLNKDNLPPKDNQFLLLVQSDDYKLERLWMVAEAVYRDIFEGGETLSSIHFWDTKREARRVFNMANVSTITGPQIVG